MSKKEQKEVNDMEEKDILNETPKQNCEQNIEISRMKKIISLK